MRKNPSKQKNPNGERERERERGLVEARAWHKYSQHAEYHNSHLWLILCNLFQNIANQQIIHNDMDLTHHKKKN
jgi:hypothetical protein